MATVPIGNADTKTEVRAEFREKIDAARVVTEVDQFGFEESWAVRHNREIWRSKDWEVGREWVL